LCRASTYKSESDFKDVDGRDEPGHDRRQEGKDCVLVLQPDKHASLYPEPVKGAADVDDLERRVAAEAALGPLALAPVSRKHPLAGWFVSALISHGDFKSPECLTFAAIVLSPELPDANGAVRS
jgi:hypothetical protein